MYFIGYLLGHNSKKLVYFVMFVCGKLKLGTSAILLKLRSRSSALSAYPKLRLEVSCLLTNHFVTTVRTYVQTFTLHRGIYIVSASLERRKDKAFRSEHICIIFDLTWIVLRTGEESSDELAGPFLTSTHKFTFVLI